MDRSQRTREALVQHFGGHDDDYTSEDLAEPSRVRDRDNDGARGASIRRMTYAADRRRIGGAVRPED